MQIYPSFSGPNFIYNSHRFWSFKNAHFPHLFSLKCGLFVVFFSLFIVEFSSMFFGISLFSVGFSSMFFGISLFSVGFSSMFFGNSLFSVGFSSMFFGNPLFSVKLLSFNFKLSPKSIFSLNLLPSSPGSFFYYSAVSLSISISHPAAQQFSLHLSAMH